MLSVEGLKIDLSEYVEDNRDKLVRSLQKSPKFEVEKNEEVCTVNWYKSSTHAVVWTNSFEYTVYEQDLFEDFVNDIQTTIGSDEFDVFGRILHTYERKLNVDEGNCHEFVSELVDEVESLGYSVKHERSSAMLVGSETVQKELKWWFYINEDGEIPPHGFDLYFEVDGIYIRGYVTIGEKNEEEFRQILTKSGISTIR